MRAKTMLRTIAMASLAALTIVVTPARAAEFPYSPDAAVSGTAQICVERWEDNGALNTWPVRVVLSNQVTITLAGGRAVCTFALAGTYNVSIEWTDEHEKEHRGNSLLVSVTLRKRAELFICNTSAGPADGTWASGWIIRYTSKRAHDRCR